MSNEDLKAIRCGRCEQQQHSRNMTGWIVRTITTMLVKAHSPMVAPSVVIGVSEQSTLPRRLRLDPEGGGEWGVVAAEAKAWSADGGRDITDTGDVQLASISRGATSPWARKLLFRRMCADENSLASASTSTKEFSAKILDY